MKNLFAWTRIGFGIALGFTIENLFISLITKKLNERMDKIIENVEEKEHT